MKVIKTENAGIQIDCDISKLTDKDYQDINELYLDNLLVTFINQPFETLPFAKLIHKMGTFANWNQMLWKQDGSNLSKSGFVDPFVFETDSLTSDPDNSYPVQRVQGKALVHRHHQCLCLP